MTATTLTNTATKKPNTDDLPYLDVIKDSYSLHQHYQKIRLQTPLNTYSLLVESGLISAEQLQETLNDANRPKNQHIGFFLRKKNQEEKV